MRLKARRGPKPGKELVLARAWQGALALADDEGRPTQKAVAKKFGVGVRQLQSAYFKHSAQVQREYKERIVSKIGAGLRHYRNMTTEERRREDEKDESAIGYETTLYEKRMEQSRRRAKKKR